MRIASYRKQSQLENRQRSFLCSRSPWNRDNDNDETFEHSKARGGPKKNNLSDKKRSVRQCWATELQAYLPYVTKFRTASCLMREGNISGVLLRCYSKIRTNQTWLNCSLFYFISLYCRIYYQLGGTLIIITVRVS